MLARMSHPMHTYLLGLRRIRAFVARLTHATQNNTNTGKHGTRTPIAGLTSASEPNKPTLEPERHSMDLHQLPSTQQTKQRHRRPERSAHLLPTYLIWYEDQGDVVPLRRDKGLA